MGGEEGDQSMGGACFGFGGVGEGGFGEEEGGGDGDGAFEGAADDFGGLDDADFNGVEVAALGGVEAVVADALAQVVGRDGGDFDFFLAAGDGAGEEAKGGNGGLGASFESTFEVDGVGGGGGGAVADGFAGAFSGLAPHLRAEVFDGVLELECVGDGDGDDVVADEGLAPLALKEEVLGFGAEGDADGIGEGGGAAQDGFSGLGVEGDNFAGHGDWGAGLGGGRKGSRGRGLCSLGPGLATTTPRLGCA